MFQRRGVRFYALLAGLACVIGFLVGIAGDRLALQLPDRWISVPWAADGDYLPGRVEPGEPEMVLVFIGSPSCVWSTHESLPPLVEKAKVALSSRADSLGRSFTALGAVPSVGVERGLDFLGGFGLFDEIAVGSGWSNLTLLKYVYNDFPGQAATPQVVVLERLLQPGTRQLIAETVLFRSVGVEPMRTWAEHGFPLPAHGQ